MYNPLLTVDLREGFFDDEVVLRVDGKEVFRDSSVKTRMQTGLARRITPSVAPGSVKFEVELPKRGAHAERTLALDAPVFVGVTLRQDGTLELVEQGAGFQYA